MELPINYNGAHYNYRRLVREEYRNRQGGKCYYCKETLSEAPPKNVQDKKVNKLLYPSAFFDNPIHLHHNHKTGMTIGAVHAHCNAVLWEYHDE